MTIVATRWADGNHIEAIVNSLLNIANRSITITGVWTDDGEKQNHAVDTLYLYCVGIAYMCATLGICFFQLGVWR